MKKQLVKGTLILTGAGIITRIIGFGYRIFLAGTLGETGLGVYQMIFPVYSICFTLYAAGIQTAVSQMISHEPARCHAGIIKSGMLLSLLTALVLSCTVWNLSDLIGTSFLGVSETAPLLRILAVVFPFCGITAVINGYFYGISNARIPGITQIVEQLFRVALVMVTAFFFLAGKMTASIAVLGLLAGELASHFYNISHLLSRFSLSGIMQSKGAYRHLFALSLPLSGNKLVIALLGSVESILIPAMLMRYGYSGQDALAIFGILTGVVLPFLLFPGTLTNSLSVLLLPAIARSEGQAQYDSVRRTTNLAIRYSILLGVLTSSLFLNFGREIGDFVFHSENAGKLLTALAFLCPFLYVTTTLTSVINGMGKTGITFLHNVLGLCVRILFLVLITPQKGIYGYLLGLLLSQILACVLNAVYLARARGVQYFLMNHFVWPMIYSGCLLYLAKAAGNWLAGKTTYEILRFVFLIPAAFLILLYLHYFRLIDWKDFLGRK